MLHAGKPEGGFGVKKAFNISKVLFSVFLISILVIGGMATVSSAATGPIKIMPVGDSVTAGIGDPNMGAYRTDLYTYYKNAGISFDFVGSQSGGPSSLPDKNHEGHSGWTIPQIASNINSWLDTYNPDVVLLWIGGNDMLLNRAPNTTGLSNLIDQITTRKPNLTLFVADYYALPPSNVISQIVPQYDAAIPGIVQSKYNAGKHVYFVKLSDVNLVSSDYYTDNLHLTPSGYSKIATIWNNGTISVLKSMGTTGTPTPTPSIATATPTPTPSGATATPTPSTAKPTPTPTAGTPAPGGIKVQFYSGNTAASSNTIYPNFKVVNTGTAPINLSDVKIRYYFTNDGTQANSFACDYSTIGSGNVTGSFTTIAAANADRCLEVGFTSGAGTLAANASAEVKSRIWKSDWSNFTQTNDYSFNATATNYVDATTVTGYIAGALKWGTEP